MQPWSWWFSRCRAKRDAKILARSKDLAELKSQFTKKSITILVFAPKAVEPTSLDAGKEYGNAPSRRLHGDIRMLNVTPDASP
jgi:hypothetical protein